MSHMASILVTQVARKYDLSRRTVLRMIERGELQTIEKLEWSTGPFLLDPDHVAQVFAAKAAAKERASTPTQARLSPPLARGPGR